MGLPVFALLPLLPWIDLPECVLRRYLCAVIICIGAPVSMVLARVRRKPRVQPAAVKRTEDPESILEEDVNKNRTISIVAITLLILLALPMSLAGQQSSRYKLFDLGTLGGPQSYVYSFFFDTNWYTNVLNNQGTVAGYADTANLDLSPFCFNINDCNAVHGFQGQNGVMSDLGVLAPGWSSMATWISSTGLVAGMSQNGAFDPTFPSLGTFPEVRAVLWKNGKIQDLGTLGQGVMSAALAVNDAAQVVGVSTNCSSDTDPSCNPGTFPIQADFWGWNKPTRAFLWQNGAMQDLGTLGGTDAAALFINNLGQVAGISYTDSNPSTACPPQPTMGAFLWQNGKMQNLGSFGGTCTYPTGLNNLGQIIGQGTESDDQTWDAFLWDGSLHKLPNAFGGMNTRPNQLNEHGVTIGFASLPGEQQTHAVLWASSTSGMTDLGTLDGDACSGAFSLNLAGQVVGFSTPCDSSRVRAFLWQHGSMVDLNTLIPASATLYLAFPASINDRAEIAGIGFDVNGNQHAFLLSPCGVQDTACQNAPAGPAFKPPQKKIPPNKLFPTGTSH